MPLDELAKEIIRIRDWDQSTPVLVAPSYLSLRRPFFLTLVAAIAKRTDRPIRMDWQRPLPGYYSFVGDWLARRSVARHNRALRALSAESCPQASIQITASIARPTVTEPTLVIGLADSTLTLPSWTTSIRLGGTPSPRVALQSLPTD